MNNYVAPYDRTLLQTIAAVRGGSATVRAIVPYLEQALAPPQWVDRGEVFLEEIVQQHKQMMHGRQTWLLANTEITCQSNQFRVADNRAQQVSIKPACQSSSLID